MNPGGRAGHWKMNNFEIGKTVVFQSFPKCQLRNYRGKIEKKNNFGVFQTHLVQINPGDVLVIGKNTFEIGKSVIFSKFS